MSLDVRNGKERQLTDQFTHRQKTSLFLKEDPVVLDDGKKQAIHNALDIVQGQGYQATVKMIRKNTEGNGSRPLIYENYSSSQATQNLARLYDIPEEFILEMLSMGQVLGYIPGCLITADNDALTTHDSMSAIESKVAGLQTGENSDAENIMQGLHYYLSKLHEIGFIKQYKENNITREQMKEGLLRRRSLNDKALDTIPTFFDFCKYVLTNLSIIDSFFHNDALDLMIETSGLPVDDMVDRNTTKFSTEKGVINIGPIRYPNNVGILQSVDAHLRFIPSFSPVGITLTVGFDVYDAEGALQRDNYFYIAGITFEVQKNDIVPIVHTMQNSGHNLGFDQSGNLVFLREPVSQEDKEKGYISLIPDNALSDEDDGMRQRLNHYLNEALKAKFEIPKDVDVMVFLYAFLTEKMSFLGFDHIETIKPEEQRRLLGHNQSREGSELWEHAIKKYSEYPGIISNGSGIPSLAGRTILHYPKAVAVLGNMISTYEELLARDLAKFGKRKIEYENGVETTFRERYDALPDLIENIEQEIVVFGKNEEIAKYNDLFQYMTDLEKQYIDLEKQHKHRELKRSCMQNFVVVELGSDVWDKIDPYDKDTGYTVLNQQPDIHDKIKAHQNMLAYMSDQLERYKDLWLLEDNSEEMHGECDDTYPEINQFFQLLCYYKQYIVGDLSVVDAIKSIGLISADGKNIFVYFPFLSKFFKAHNLVYKKLDEKKPIQIPAIKAFLEHKTKNSQDDSFYENERSRLELYKNAIGQLQEMVSSEEKGTLIHEFYRPLSTVEDARNKWSSKKLAYEVILLKVKLLEFKKKREEEQALQPEEDQGYEEQVSQLEIAITEKLNKSIIAYGVDITTLYDYDGIAQKLFDTQYFELQRGLEHLKAECNQLSVKFDAGKNLSRDEQRLGCIQAMAIDPSILHESIERMFAINTTTSDQLLQLLMSDKDLQSLWFNTTAPYGDNQEREKFDHAFYMHMRTNGIVR